jgi:hypothetical protein
MATQAEIQQQYDNDKSQKILQLQTTFVGRTVQSAKQAGLLKNGISVISTTATADDFDPKINSSILGKSDTKNRGIILSTIRDGMIEKFSTNDGVFSYVILECICSITSIDSNKITLNYSIIERLYLKGQNSRTASEIFTGGGGLVKIEVPNNSNAFPQLRKELSAFAYPVANITSNGRFDTYLQFVNTKLKVESIPQLDSLALVGFAVFSLGDYNSIFPKPDGLIEEPTTPTPTGAGVVVPNVPTTSIDVTGSNLNSTTSPISTTSPTSTTPTRSSGIKYLSIEAVKDDDLPIRSETDPTAPIRYISVRAVTDEEAEASFRSGGLSAITTQQTEIRNVENPIKPTDKVNNVVAENERIEIERRTLAQRQAEESDALVKAQSKEKLLSGPTGPNPDLKDGRTASIENKSTPIPEDKKPDKLNPEKTNTETPTFRSWIIKNPVNSGDKFIWNRSLLKESPYPPDQKPPINENVGTPKNYKSLFDWGTSLSKFFSGYENKIQSPIDICLLMNPANVGGFNKNLPYLFEEGSEPHLLIVRAYPGDKDKGVLGKSPAVRNKGKLDANWSENPYWCGLTVDFMLYGNGIYRSDEKNLPIAGTGDVDSSKTAYFFNSPVNAFDKSVDAQKNAITKLDGDILSKKKSISSIDNSLKDTKTGLYGQRTKLTGDLTRIQADLLVDPTPKLEKTERTKKIQLDKVESDIRNKETKKESLLLEITELEKRREEIRNKPIGKYIPTNDVIKLQNGIHFTKNKGFTEEGLELWSIMKDWPGAYIVRRDVGKEGKISGHTEVVLHIDKRAIMYTIFGNSSYGDGSRNGTTLGFKRYDTISDFGSTLYIVKRGTKKPYTNGIGVSLKKTELYDEYVERIQSKDKKLGITNTKQSAYNLLRDIMEV